ncbi:MAG: heavy metal translocating P-type ATPase, partial [Saprospiraceae bacterium]|nr:heavy metal translocating P-type ATPase [Saprospiraceae bacterium]
MTHTYQIKGMTCNHCVETVKKALEGIEGILSAEVTLEPPLAIVAMSRHISEDTMNMALAAAGNYSLKMASEHNHTAHVDQEHIHHHSSDAGSTGNKKQTTGHHAHTGHGGHAGHGSHNPAHGEMGHDHHRMMIADFRKRFWISLVLAVPILLLSPMIQHWLGVSWRFPGDKYVLFALSSVVYAYGGKPFLGGFIDEVRKKAPGMMTLIAMAISVAYFYSAATTFGLPGE